MPRARLWTKKEEQAFLQGVGTYGLDWLRRKGGPAYDYPNAPKKRSVYAVYSKARRMYGGGGALRGSYSINHIVKTTGYSITQLRRAMSACRQKWQRLSPTGSFLIYEEQFNELMEWLTVDYWSKKHRLYNCLWCGTDSVEHRSLGLCKYCYGVYSKRLLRSGLPIDTKELLALVKQKRKEEDNHFLEKAAQQMARGRAVQNYGVNRLISELQNA